MTKTWKWFDGKKTIIGTVLLIIYGIPHLEEYIGMHALDIVYYLGTALGASGLIHKTAKKIKS